MPISARFGERLSTGPGGGRAPTRPSRRLRPATRTRATPSSSGKEFTLDEFQQWYAVQGLGGRPFNAIGYHHTEVPTPERLGRTEFARLRSSTSTTPTRSGCGPSALARTYGSTRVRVTTSGVKRASTSAPIPPKTVSGSMTATTGGSISSTSGTATSRCSATPSSAPAGGYWDPRAPLTPTLERRIPLEFVAEQRDRES